MWSYCPAPNTAWFPESSILHSHAGTLMCSAGKLFVTFRGLGSHAARHTSFNTILPINPKWQIRVTEIPTVTVTWGISSQRSDIRGLRAKSNFLWDWQKRVLQGKRTEANRANTMSSFRKKKTPRMILDWCLLLDPDLVNWHDDASKYRLQSTPDCRYGDECLLNRNIFANICFGISLSDLSDIQ